MMKSVSYMLLTLGFGQDSLTGPRGDTGLGPRRYNDLLAIVMHYEKGFDERKYWAYGCNCLILGDRPMSEMGKGKPVDDLDFICRDYKSCQRCARMEFGKDCIGEMVKYNWKSINGEVVCTDDAGTCKRNLCECDLDYAKKIPGVINVFDNNYHLFWSTNGWKPETDCKRTPGTSQPECCQVNDGPFKIFNTLKQECCQDGSIKRIGFCPPN